MNENVAARTPSLPADLPQLGTELMAEARGSDSGHAALTLTPAEGGELKQTLVAVRSGGALDPEHWNGPASLQVLDGKAAVSTVDDPLGPGGWTVIDGGASIQATDDLVALLTVSSDGR